MANLNDSLTNRLRTYEQDLEKHLKTVLLQLEEQIRNTDQTLKQTKRNNASLLARKHPLKQEIKKINKEVSTNNDVKRRLNVKSENDVAARIKANTVLTELREDLKNELLKEKDLRFNIDEINHQINLAQTQVDSVAWPEKNDVKLLNSLVGKAHHNVKNLEKDKRIQDSYIERLRRDVEIAENELEQLGVTTRHLKFEHDDTKEEFVRLQDKYSTFQAGTLQLEDHFNKLMKSLNDNRNKVQLIDKRKKDLSSNTIGNKQNDVEYLATQRGAELKRRILRLAALREKQEQKIIKRTATNAHIKTVVNQLKQRHIPLVEHELEESQKCNKTLKRQSNQTQHEHSNAQSQKNTFLSPNEVQTISSQFENMEKLLFYNSFKLKSYLFVLEELNELLNRRQEVDKLFTNSYDPSIETTALKRSKSDILGNRYNQKNYKNVRDSITQLVRKKIALEYRKKRIENKIIISDTQQNQVISEMNMLKNEETMVQKARNEKSQAMSRKYKNEETSNNNDEMFNKRILYAETQLIHLKELYNRSKRKYNEILELCADYNCKLNILEEENNLEKKYVEHLQEIHLLQKRHQFLEKNIWTAQKNIEFTVLRRDYIVNKARTTLGTRNEIRMQRKNKIDQIKLKLEKINLEIDKYKK
ncbi:unnamed protein product [Bursaphelenchus okinawaensis]|uniref:Uncharacterized protein n=1 Tax=Bursaphelenchus okinawaensis TaxID=465554 RepID=A0A811KQN3_9BILA|nr:unnamed protein product [Bursaphelenchus okinawaensis]CAG9109203.1 unnamed protein product [Bursaphelenchus okinawaensis]